MFENSKKNETSESSISEEILFEFVLQEMEIGNPREDILTKAVLESDGDDDKAKLLYLHYRVEAIQNLIKTLDIDPTNIDKNELFILIENDFQGYKKSSSLLKKTILYFIVFTLGVILVAVYSFISKPIQYNLNTSKNLEKKEQNLEKMEHNIRDNMGNLYKEIQSPYSGKIWLDRNLGAKQVCRDFNDEECFGDYFQWGRGDDGHEKPDSDAIKDLSSKNTPGHNKFIIGSPDNSYDWLQVRNNKLWQGYYGENNPCPKGFRVPTAGEFKEELIDNGENKKYKIFNSFLKLPIAGFRNFNGVVSNQSFDGRYWTSSTKSQFSLSLNSSNRGEKPYLFFFERSNAYNIRCVKNSK